MKTLYLIRHAKSSWKYSNLSDIDRPLNKRGKRDAPEMGQRLKTQSIYFDLMISSPANRALTTCKTIAGILSYPAVDIEINDDIYHGSEAALLRVLKHVDNKFNTIAMFGHNPGFTGFANALTKSDLWNIPTCGVFGSSFDVTSWADIDYGKGQKVFYDFPKNLAS